MVSTSTSSRQQRHRHVASSSSARRRQQSHSSHHRGHSTDNVSLTTLPFPPGHRRRRAPHSDLRFQQRQRQRQQPRHLSVPNDRHRCVFLSPVSTSHHHSRSTSTLLITTPSSSSSVETASDSLRSHQSSSRQSTPSNPPLPCTRNYSPPSCRSVHHQLSLQPALSSSRQSTPRTQRQVRFSTPISAVSSRRSLSPAYPSAPWHSPVRVPSPASLGRTRTRSSSSIRTPPSARPSHYGPLSTSSSLSINACTRTTSRPASPRPSYYGPSPLSNTSSTELSAIRRRQRSRSPIRPRRHGPPPPARVSRLVRSVSPPPARIHDRPQHRAYSPSPPLRTGLPALIMLQERLLRRQQQRQ